MPYTFKDNQKQIKILSDFLNSSKNLNLYALKEMEFKFKIKNDNIIIFIFNKKLIKDNYSYDFDKYDSHILNLFLKTKDHDKYIDEYNNIIHEFIFNECYFVKVQYINKYKIKYNDYIEIKY